MRDNAELLSFLNEEIIKRLDDPKNVAHGDFPEKLGIVIDGVVEEYFEVIEIMEKARINMSIEPERLIEELSDLAAYCAFGIRLCKKAKIGEIV